MCIRDSRRPRRLGPRSPTSPNCAVLSEVRRSLARGLSARAWTRRLLTVLLMLNRYDQESQREGLPPRPCVDTSRAAEYYYFGGSYEEFQHPKRVIRTVKNYDGHAPLHHRQNAASFFLPPVILATYHYWRCPRTLQLDLPQVRQGRNAKQL